MKALAGSLILIAVASVALHGLWRGRKVKPDGFRHRDSLGNPFGPDRRDLE